MTKLYTANTKIAAATLTANTKQKAATTYLKNKRQITYIILFTFCFFLANNTFGQNKYKLITSTSDLVAGEKYIITSGQSGSSVQVLGYQNTNNRPQVTNTGGAPFTVSSNVITLTPATANTNTNSAYEITLGGSSGAWTLNDTYNGFLYAASSSKNYLQTQATNDANGKWAITFSSNVASITAQGSNTNKVMQYNSSASLFSCYSSASQASVYLFRRLYTVTYDGNGNDGGSVPTDASSPYFSGATVTVKANTGSLVKSGKTFAGWNTALDGSGTSYNPSNTFAMPTNNVTLYAQWTSNTSPSLSITGTPTNHGSVCPNTAALPVVYTITNSGSVQADGVAVSTNNSEFAVSGLSSTTIAAGGTATYTVTFTPVSAGAKTATITVSSTTSGSNTPTSSLSGTGLATVAQAVSASSATAITAKSATLNGNVTTLGVCPAAIEKGFVYALTSDNSDPIVGGSGVTKTSVAGIATGAYTLGLTNLLSSASYSYKAYVYDGTTYTYSTVQTFNTLIALVISGTTSHGSVCSGTAASPITYTITNNGAYTVSGVALSSSDGQFVPASLSSTTIVAGGTATYTVTFTPASAGAKTATITVSSSTAGIVSATSNLTGTGIAPVTPSVSITSSPAASLGTTTVCNGTNVSFTATPTNGGVSPSYQWKLNGTNVGTNSNSYSNNTLATGNTISCDITVSGGCVTTTSASSNTITMAVNPIVIPSVNISITTGSTPTCTGNALTLTATPTNGGVSPSYQWKLNGSNVGSNSTTYSNTNITDGSSVTCVMTSNAACVSPTTATSNTITINNNTPAQPSVISGTVNILPPQSGQTYSVTNVTGVTYTWSYSGTGVTIASGQGTNAINLDFANNATSGTLTVTPSVGVCTGTAKTLVINVVPANDECSGAINITPSSDLTCNAVNGSIAGATQSIAPVTTNTGTSAAPIADVWFKFTATGTNHVVYVNPSSSFDAVVDVRSGACNGTTLANADDYAAGGMETVPLYGLTVGADYYVRVYHNKASAGDAAIPADPTFTVCVTTPCFYESFTGTTFPPTGWANSNVSRSTLTVDYNTSPGAATFSANSGTLTTPSIANPTTLKFYLGRTNNTTAKTLTIDVSTTSQSSGFTTIATFDHNNVPAGLYNQYTVDLSSYSSYSDVWIRFSKSSSTTSPWRLDDIAVSCTPVCTPPTNPSGTITALNVLCDGADLHYDQVAAGNIVYYWQNAVNGKSTTLGTTDADLDVSATGNYYVRAYNTSTSCWSTNLVGPTNITIANTTTSIAPLTTQNIATNTNGTTLTVTEGSTVSSRQWKYTTTSGSGYIDLTGQNASTYVPNFASGGVYYVVCESTYPNPCGAVLSKEVKIVVTAPGPPMITHTPLANTSSTTAQTVVATITSSTSLTYCGSAPTLSYRINGGSWVTITGTNSGNTYSFTIPGQPTGTQIEYFISACNSAGTTTSPSNVTQASPYLSFYEYTILCTGGSSTLLAFQGFETTPPTNEWTYTRGCGGSCTNFTVKSKASNYNPNTDNPPSSRIRTGSYSYQQTSDGALTTTLTFPNVSIPTGATNIKAIVHVASISTTSSNGADGDDYVKVYAGVNGGVFPATADLALFGKSNIRYGFSATGSLTTTAGTPISFTPSAGGYQPTDGTTLLQVNLPDGSTNAALKIELRNNDPSSNEVWVVDDIELWADVPVASGRFYRSKQNGKWDAISTWEVANTVDGTYNQACDIPSFSNSDSIMINTGTTVYITTNHTGNQGIDQTNILTGGKLILGNYNLQINDGKIYSDFNVNGTFEDNTVGSSLSFASGATWSLGSNGVIIKTSSSGLVSYRDNYDGDISTIPATASWYYRYKGVGTTNTVAVGMYYPNLYFENAFDNTNYSFSASGSALTGASGGYCTVKGNMDIGTSGTGTVSVYNNNINIQAMKVLGNMTIGTGSTFTNTSYDGTTTSTRGNGTGIELYGNLTNNGTLTNNGNNTGILRFKGTGTQTVSGSGTFNLYNVELDKPTQTLVDQQVNLSTQNNLNFKGGILKTGANVFSISNATYNTAVTGHEVPYTGAATPSYVNDKYVWGRLERAINSSNIYVFPVGDDASSKGYNPIRLEQKSGVGKATAWFIPGNPGTITAGPTMVGCGGRHFYHYTGMTGEGKWHFESSDNTSFNYNVYLHPNQNNINTKPNDDGISYPYFYSNNYRTLKKPSDGNNDWSAYAGDGDVCVVGTYYNCPGANYTGFSDFAIPGGDGLSTALPVEIISFTGQCNDDGALLKWETASELNSKEFLLQRSTNGQNYETIAKIAAAGNSNRLLSYSYTDVDGAGNHYYRLVEIDINGRENVHTFISVSCDEINSTQVYYSAPKIVMDITANLNKKIQYSIFEVSGKLIQNEEKQIIRGFNHFELNREQLAKGIYIIQIVDGDKVNAVKVMVQ